MNRRQRLFLVATVLLLTGLPTLLAALIAPPGTAFAGFLFNPIDGSSYLAKMYQGWQGSWTFRLPFTADPGPGTYLFLYYLLLGHLARLLNVSLPVMFHLARLLGAAALAWSLSGFFNARLYDPRAARIASWLAALGSGVGWMATFAGAPLTADLWVAETYPFLSAFANPHFPLALALMLWLLTPVERPNRWWLLLMAGLSLATLLPFGVVIAGLALAGETLWGWVSARQVTLRNLRTPFWMGLGALPVLVYQAWVIQNHAQLAAWNAQNVTPSPPMWDVLLSLSPALILALVGLLAFRRDARDRVLIVWLLAGLALMYVPFSLQRRFMLGLYIPAAGLAGMGIAWLQAKRPLRWLFALTLALSLFANLIIIAGGLATVSGGSPALTLSTGERDALSWIAANTPQDALVLAPVSLGSFIPAWTGRHVIYGHPFETVNAGQEKFEVDQFFNAPAAIQAQMDFIKQRHVDFVFFSNRYRGDTPGSWIVMPPAMLPFTLVEVFRSGDTIVLAVPR